MKLVSVIILNWNGKRYIRDCLNSVVLQTYPDIEVIVVDNASSDNSQDIVNKEYPFVELIENSENKGFSEAINQGIKASSGSYILSLNNDVIMDPAFISQAVEAASMEKQIGSVSGKLMRVAPKGEDEVLDSVGITMFKNRLACDTGEREIDVGQYDSFRYVFGACAAAALYKKEMLEDIKLNSEYFDEAFFAFLEDVDLSWRAQLRNWKCIYAPSAVAYHHRGGTAVRRSNLVEIHNYKNRYLMIMKNDSFLGFIKNIHHFLVTDLIKSGALLIRCPRALLGLIGVAKELPNTLKKRSMIQRNRKVSWQSMEGLMQEFDYGNWIKRHLLKPEW